MARRTSEDGAVRLALWIATPQILALGGLAIVASIVGFGWSLLVLLTLALAASCLVTIVGWRQLLKLRNPPYLFVGILFGLCAGIAASALDLAAMSADRHIGSNLGGSLVGSLFDFGVSTGAEAGYNALQTNDPVTNTLLAPHSLFTGFIGGIAGALLVVMLLVGGLAAPVLAGFLGGFAATFAAKRHAAAGLNLRGEAIRTAKRST